MHHMTALAAPRPVTPRLPLGAARATTVAPTLMLLAWEVTAENTQRPGIPAQLADGLTSPLLPRAVMVTSEVVLCAAVFKNPEGSSLEYICKSSEVLRICSLSLSLHTPALLYLWNLYK